ncbi:cutinase domain-containing protein [Hirsutella rhossiliensis]|uniref:Cutinase n=1 Tax=Hirsutella rhossiliensis TaxID=111463 RepID=A0A9P8N374_9HYPO|nr:cutinase domain-containing protein [Hirsutella rhossiliensis]KAH0963882.1 cutinase domain-containing protein [Hirsutella rhossiliensis]
MRPKGLALLVGPKMLLLLALVHLSSAAAAAFSNHQQHHHSPSQQQADKARRQWKALNVLLTGLLRVPALGALARDVCGVITLAQALVGEAAGVSSVRDDAGCADVTVLFARGTCDPGNVGVTNAPTFFDSLAALLRRDGRSLGVRGFAYPASVEDFLAGTKARGREFASTLQATAAECPDTRLVLGGYSQGAMVMHDAAAFAGPQVMSKARAIVLFGDPYSNQAVANVDPSRVKVFCHQGDNICEEGGDLILPPHLTYAKDAAAAAAFVVSRL